MAWLELGKIHCWSDTTSWTQKSERERAWWLRGKMSWDLNPALQCLLSITHLLQFPNACVGYWSVNRDYWPHVHPTHGAAQPSREPSPSCQWDRVVKKITVLRGSLCATKCSSEQCKFINKSHKHIYSCNRANVVQRRTRMPTKHVISGTQASSQSWEDPDIYSDAGGRLQRMFWRKALEPMIWAQSLIRKLSVCEIWKAGSVEDQGQK